MFFLHSLEAEAELKPKNVMSPAKEAATRTADKVEYKLRYFEIRGLGEPIRLMFHYANVPFEDIRVTQQEWSSVKPSNMFEIVSHCVVHNFTFSFCQQLESGSCRNWRQTDGNSHRAWLSRGSWPINLVILFRSDFLGAITSETEKAFFAGNFVMCNFEFDQT